MMNEKQRKERQARYSLYSTDSEDQVRAGDKGFLFPVPCNDACGREYVLPRMPCQ